MANFNKDKKGGFRSGGFGGGKPSFKNKSWGNDSDRERMMYAAKCSECGKNCEVPFRPTNGKPVRCDDCFGNQRDNDFRGGRDNFNDRGPRPSFRSERPVAAPVHTASNEETKKALAEISTKLDRLVVALEKMTSAPAPKVEAKKEEVSVAPKKTEAKKVAVKAEPKKVEVKKAPARKAEVKKAPAKTVAKKAPAPKKVVAKKKK